MNLLSGFFSRRVDDDPEAAAVEASGTPGAVEVTREIAVPGGVLRVEGGPETAAAVARAMRPDRPIVADDPLADPGPVDEVDVHADSAIAMLRAERDAARQEAAHLREEATRSRYMLKDANGRADEAAHFADQAARAASVAVQRATLADEDRLKAVRAARELRRELDAQRPAPTPEQLAERLRYVWLATPPARDGDAGPRWHAVAQAAVDAVRGMWPLEAWPLTPGEAEQQPAAAPKSSPGSGAEAAVPSPAAPSAPGDPTATGPMRPWPYKTSPGGGAVEAPDVLPAVAGATAPGDPTPEPEPDPARETLAQTLARSELDYFRRTWPEFSDQIRDEYLGLADDVIAAGWQPPTGPGKP